MLFILDTHFLIWSLFESGSLPDEVREIIQDDSSHIEYSVISLWETEIKHMKHPKSFTFSSDEIFKYAQAEGYHMIDLKPDHIGMLGSLNEPTKRHKDPFDRMLIAQAKSENAYLVTHDKRLGEYEEECVAYF